VKNAARIHVRAERAPPLSLPQGTGVPCKENPRDQSCHE
jgi:hypothetical protein